MKLADWELWGWGEISSETEGEALGKAPVIPARQLVCLGGCTVIAASFMETFTS